MLPDQSPRDLIARKLEEAGWSVQCMKKFNPGASLGVAVIEYPTDAGPADFVLFINRLPFGVIEVLDNKNNEFQTLSDCQKARFANGVLTWTQEGYVLPFIYQSTGVCIQFTDNRDPVPKGRTVFNFHKPETMRDWIAQGTSFRRRLQGISMLSTKGMNDNQVNALKILEHSFIGAIPRTLIQMESSHEKTYTAITTLYRLLKIAGAKKILYLVDSTKDEELVEEEFHSYRPYGEKEKFTALFNYQRLCSRFIDEKSRVCIATIQTIYSMLREEYNQPVTEIMAAVDFSVFDKPKEVHYNPSVPVETFDCIIIDDCHPSTYTIYKQVLEYFDALFIGFSSTPDSRIDDFFNLEGIREIKAKKDRLL